MKSTLIGIAVAIGCAQCAGAASGAPAEYDAIIAKHSKATGVPETLIRRVIVRESKYNPRAMNRGHFGMMQIKPATAKSMGYSGGASGLLDADTNLTYGVRYLAGAYRVARGDHDRAVRLYASGYYYDAKRAGLLADIGLGRDGKFKGPATPVAVASDTAVPQAPGQVQVQVQTVVAAAPAAPAVVPPVVPLPQIRGSVPAAPSQMAAIAAPATPSIPVPPSRGAAPAVQAPVAPSAAQVAVAVVPVPPVRGALPQIAAIRPAAPRAADGKATPVLASAAPMSPARDAGPAVTGSVPARPATVMAASVPTPSARDLAAPAKPALAPAKPAAVAANAPRTIGVQAPVFASAGPVLPAKPAAPTLAYAGGAGDDVAPQLRGVRAPAPLPPQRP